GNPVQLDRVLEGFDALCTKYDYITIEGSGGILCPICVDETKLQLEDIIKELNASCLIIADAGLGTINDVGLTVAYMKEKNIPIKGIIFNRFKEGDVMHEDNLKMCQSMTGLKVLACVKEEDTDLDISLAVLESLYE
ncbi:MAG: dethiobiotin synthase, partial [Anaerovorax sp.]